MLRGSILLPAIVVLAILQSARAQVWTITTSDFKSRQADMRAIDDQGVHVVYVGTIDDVTVPMDQFVGADRGAAGQRLAGQGGRFVVWLSTGERLVGEPVALADEKLAWKSPLLGDVTLSLRAVRAITRCPASAGALLPPAGMTAARQDDRADLLNGDSVHGVLASVSGIALGIKGEGDPVPIPLETLGALYLATTAAPPVENGVAFFVSLADGSAVAVRGARLQSGQFVLTRAGEGAKTVDDSAVTSIEQSNGPISWLSGRTPSENVQMPWLESSWPAVMNRSVTGRAMRYGDHVYTHGIGVHSYSRLTFPLEGQYASFRTQFALDTDTPMGDVNVRILVDGKVAYSREHLRTNDLSPVVSLNLGGAKTLTLEADYGGGYDIQDRLNWIEPALVRGAPVFAPALRGTR